MELKQYIREIPDFPRPGVLFKDITPLLKDSGAFRHAVDLLVEHYTGRPIEAIIGVEARGFLFAAPLAVRLEKPLIPVRKEGKLPFETHSVKYALEYGDASVEVHTDAIAPGQRVLIVDDVLATGGTLAAARQARRGDRRPCGRSGGDRRALRPARKGPVEGPRPAVIGPVPTSVDLGCRARRLGSTLAVPGIR